MSALAADLRVLALWKVAPPAHFWQLQWHIQEAVFRAKDITEQWHSLKAMQRRVFLLLIAEAIEGGDL